MLAELKARHKADDAASAYGPQVVMLSPLGGELFLRANIWPSRDEHVFRASGGGSFVYELPHDHNFDFLTVGYLVPVTGPTTGSTITRPSPARSTRRRACASSSARGSRRAS